MGITFNADEVFEMAEEIERNGEKFYRKAAKNASDKQTKQMLLDMADMEAGHLKIFQEMRTQLTAPQKAEMVFDPDNEASLYLQNNGCRPQCRRQDIADTGTHRRRDHGRNLEDSP